MVGMWGVVKEMRGEIQEIKSQNPSRSASVTQLEDTSTLRIGSNLNTSEPGSETVEMMSATIDQPMDTTINPGPSSPDDTIELGCSTDLLAAGSDEEETDVTPENKRKRSHHRILSKSAGRMTSDSFQIKVENLENVS
jgi:hypothetical protein